MTNAIGITRETIFERLVRVRKCYPLQEEEESINRGTPFFGDLRRTEQADLLLDAQEEFDEEQPGFTLTAREVAKISTFGDFVDIVFGRLNP